VLGSSLGGASYGSSTLDTYGMSLAAAIGLQSVINRLPDETTADELEAALHAHTFHATNRPRDTVIREIALDMAEELAGGDDDDAEGDGAFVNNDKRRATARSQTLPLSSAVYFAVSCNDAPTLTSLSDWRTAMRSDAVAAPLFFSGVAHCMPWGAPTVTKPLLSALTTVPALFVQSQYDGATPAEGAARTFAHMPSSKQVYVPGEYVHALFPYAAQDSDNPCVDHAVLDYLLGSDASPRSTTCGARPLELDRSISKSTSAHGSAFREPAQARELVEALHATIGRRP
jgi:pimeloyl-ACP methyl ester carboxylesterase